MDRGTIKVQLRKEIVKNHLSLNCRAKEGDNQCKKNTQ